MTSVVIMEKFNGEVTMTEYYFTCNEEKKLFIKMCEEQEQNCLVLEPNYKRSAA